MHYNAETIIFVKYLFPVLCIVPRSIINCCARLHEKFVKNGFYVIDNSAVTERDLWKDGVNMAESGKCLVENNFICHLNNLLGLRIHPIWGW